MAKHFKLKKTNNGCDDCTLSLSCNKFTKDDIIRFLKSLGFQECGDGYSYTTFDSNAQTKSKQD